MARNAAVRALLTAGGARVIATTRVEATAKLTGARAVRGRPPARGRAARRARRRPGRAGTLRGVDTAAARALPGVTAVLTAADLPDFPRLDSARGRADAAVHRRPDPARGLAGRDRARRVDRGGGGRPARPSSSTARPSRRCCSGSGERTPAMGADAVVFDQGRRRRRPRAGRRARRADLRAGRAAPQHDGDLRAPSPGGTATALTLWDAVQAGSTVIPVVSTAFGIDAANVRVVSPHTGGGFGGKGYIWPHEILAAAARPGGGAAGEAAPAPGRPVLERRLPAVDGADDPARRRRRRACCSASSTHAVNNAGLVETHVEPATEASKSLYAVARDPAAPGDRAGLAQRADADARARRGPRAVGVGERDERAGRRGRRRPPRPAAGQLRRGLARRRQAVVEQPAARGVRGGRPPLRLARPPRAPAAGRAVAHRARHGHLLDGQLPLPRRRAGAPGADGRAVVESNVHDIGSGAQTVLAQIAAEELGVPLDRVAMRWGDTDLPRTGPTYGSSTTMGTGSAVAAAARDVAKQLADLGIERRRDGGGRGRRARRRGHVRAARRGDVQRRRRGHALRHAHLGRDLRRGGGRPRLRHPAAAARGRRLLRGRIVNALTARAQMIGAIVWGWGKATMEESDQEPVHGRWLAKNLSNVAVPVNADIPADIDVSFVEEFDEAASLIGARGIGELGATGRRRGGGGGRARRGGRAGARGADPAVEGARGLTRPSSFAPRDGGCGAPNGAKSRAPQRRR